MALRQFLDNLGSKALLARLNLALDGASLGIWDWDLRTNEVQFDRRWCEMLGLDHERMPMELSTWESRVHPDDLAPCYADIQRYLEARTGQYENIHRMRHADGHWVYILDRGRISGWDEGGEPIRFTGTHFDCTATERAKLVLQNQQSLLTDMVRNLPAAVAMFDLEQRYVSASDAWLDYFGLADRRIVGRTPRGCGAPLPAAWAEPLEAARNGGGSEVEDGLQVEVPGLGQRYLRWSMRPWESDERVAGVIVTCTDVTTLTEQRLSRERESRLSALGLMAAGVAHEINSPLQALMVNTTMIASELESGRGDLPFMNECNTSIAETTQQIARIIHALKTVSRHASDDPLTSVSTGEMVSYMVELCRARFRSGGVDFRTEGNSSTATIRARPADTGQILLNLLNNAFDAVVDTPGAWVRLDVEQRPGHVLFRVVDSGDGVPESIRDQLMTPFVTTKPLGKGTGLGLSLSKSLADKQGAELTYVSAARHTTFELRFAAVREES